MCVNDEREPVSFSPSKARKGGRVSRVPVSKSRRPECTLGRRDFRVDRRLILLVHATKIDKGLYTTPIPPLRAAAITPRHDFLART